MKILSFFGQCLHFEARNSNLLIKNIQLFFKKPIDKCHDLCYNVDTEKRTNKHERKRKGDTKDLRDAKCGRHKARRSALSGKRVSQNTYGETPRQLSQLLER